MILKGDAEPSRLPHDGLKCAGNPDRAPLPELCDFGAEKTSDLPNDGLGSLPPLAANYCIYAKVYGERNCGTNLVEKLLEANFAVQCLQGNNRMFGYVEALDGQLSAESRGRFRSTVMDIDCERTAQSEFGWKHAVPPRDLIMSAAHRKHTLFICITKHPIWWIKSLVRHPYNPLEKAPSNLSGFVRYDWPVAKRDNLPGIERINVVELWNVKNASYLELPTFVERCVLATYEGILFEPTSFLASVGRFLVAKRQAFAWSLPSTKKDGLDFEGYRQKYRNENMCEGVSESEYRLIRHRANSEVMARFGYMW